MLLAVFVYLSVVSC